MNFSDDELDRYARHIILPQIGGIGQAALKNAHILVVGAGGIGSPALQYLAAAGIGTISVIDDDVVDLSNLQRQTLFGTDSIGTPKVRAARDRLHAINPEVTVHPINDRITPENADALIAGKHVVLDGTDRFATRLLVADTALRHKVPLVSAAVGQFDGQLAVFRGWEADKPCYRCLVGNDPETPGINCAEQGVLGALTGVMGSLAALEVVRAIHPFGEDSAGKRLRCDMLTLQFRTPKLPKDPGCTTCAV